MSFEGYYRLLCEDGHLLLRDVYDSDFYWKEGEEVEKKCQAINNGNICDKPFVWENVVDETNGIDEGLGYCPGDYPLEVLKEAEYSICKHCQVGKLISNIRYKIPEGKNGKNT